MKNRVLDSLNSPKMPIMQTGGFLIHFTYFNKEREKEGGGGVVNCEPIQYLDSNAHPNHTRINKNPIKAKM